MNARTNVTEADIWERIIHPGGAMSKDIARRILEMDFTSEERQQMHDLATKNQLGQLTEEEEQLLDHYCRVGALLSVLMLRSRRTLKTAKRGS